MQQGQKKIYVLEKCLKCKEKHKFSGKKKKKKSVKAKKHHSGMILMLLEQVTQPLCKFKHSFFFFFFLWEWLCSSLSPGRFLKNLWYLGYGYEWVFFVPFFSPRFLCLQLCNSSAESQEGGV